MGPALWEQRAVNAAPQWLQLIIKANTQANPALRAGDRKEGTELLQRISGRRLTEAGAAFSAVWKGL